MAVRSAPTGVNVVWTTLPEDYGQPRDTADPLGFRAAAMRIARRLVPALTQTTFRVRGFSLTCFGLDAAQRQREMGERDRTFLRFERLVVFAQCHHYPEGLPDSVRYAGVRRARRYLGSPLDLNMSLLAHEDLLGGLWGSYVRPAIQLNFLGQRSNRSVPKTTTLKQPGAMLARTLDGEAIRDPRAVRKLVQDHTRLTDPDEAADLVAKDEGSPSKDEADAFCRVLTEYDDRKVEAGGGRPFAALRSAFEASSGNLNLDNLQSSLLTPGQAQALGEARALAELMGAVEEPYRLWVTGNAAALDKSVANNPAWGLVATGSELDIQDLLAELRRDPSLATVHGHQERMAAARGREPWVQGDPRPGRERLMPVDFTLGSIANLFQEGVRPEGRSA